MLCFVKDKTFDEEKSRRQDKKIARKANQGTKNVPITGRVLHVISVHYENIYISFLQFLSR